MFSSLIVNLQIKLIGQFAIDSKENRLILKVKFWTLIFCSILSALLWSWQTRSLFDH